MGRRGGPMVFTLLLSFLLARFAHQYYTNIIHVLILPSSIFSMAGWLVVLRIYVASAVFQPYLDLEAGDN